VSLPRHSDFNQLRRPKFPTFCSEKYYTNMSAQRHVIEVHPVHSYETRLIDTINQYAKSGRAKCHGLCKGSLIPKGALRYGRKVFNNEYGETIQWRHWYFILIPSVYPTSKLTPNKGMCPKMSFAARCHQLERRTWISFSTVNSYTICVASIFLTALTNSQLRRPEQSLSRCQNSQNCSHRSQ